MKKSIMKRIIVCGIIVVMLFSCLPVFAAEGFSVYDDNGYTSLISECDFEGLPEGVSTNVGWWFNSSFIPVKDPAEEKTHGKVAFLPYTSSAMLQFGNSWSDTWFNTNNANKTNPNKTFRNNWAQAKMEMDVYFTSTDLKAYIYMQDYDMAGEQGISWVRPRLMNFADGKITLSNAPADMEEITYNAETWYRITIYLDLVHGVYTCYRDEELLGENLRIYSEENANGVAPLNVGIGYTTSDNMTEADGAYLDNLRYSIVPLNTRKFEVTKAVHEDDFDDYNVGELPTLNGAAGGFSGNGGDIQIVNAGQSAETHQKVLRMYARNTEGTLTSSRLLSSYRNVQPDKNDTTLQLSEASLAQAQKLVVGMDIMLSDYGRGSIQYVGAKEGGGALYNLVTFRETGYMEIYGRNSAENATIRKIGYEPNKWYSIRIYFDFDANAQEQHKEVIGEKGTYTMCINGRNVVENEPLPFESAGGYPISFGFQWSTQSTDKDTYIDIDNFSMHMVDCVTTPKLSLIQQKAGEHKLICLPGKKADMIFARYDRAGVSLQDVQINKGETDTYHMIKVEENDAYKDRVFWWQLDSLTPVAGLPELTD